MTEKKSTDGTARSRWPGRLLAVAFVYVLWLAWLATIAWVNVQAGNQ